MLESFNALKSACNMDASTESLPLESLTGHEDFFAAESPYALPLLSAAAVVRFSKKAFRFFRVARWFSRNLAYACINFVCTHTHERDSVWLQDVSVVLGLPLPPAASNVVAEDEVNE